MIQFCCHVFPTVLKKLLKLKLVYFPHWLRRNAQTSSGPAGTHCFSGRDSVVRNAKPPPQRTVKMMLPTKVLILAPDQPMEHSWSPVFSNHQNSPPQKKEHAFPGLHATPPPPPSEQPDKLRHSMSPAPPNWMDLPKPLPQQVSKFKVIEARMCKIN